MVQPGAVKSHQSQSQTDRDLSLGYCLCWVTLDKSLHFSEPQFAHLDDMDTDSHHAAISKEIQSATVYTVVRPVLGTQYI